MRALRLLDWKSDPELLEVPEPQPGPGQVVIEVGGAGACHSDLHLMHEFEAGVVPWNPPFTLGHENAGWVHALGAGVKGLEVGQPVHPRTTTFTPRRGHRGLPADGGRRAGGTRRDRPLTHARDGAEIVACAAPWLPPQRRRHPRIDLGPRP